MCCIPCGKCLYKLCKCDFNLKLCNRKYGTNSRKPLCEEYLSYPSSAGIHQGSNVCVWWSIMRMWLCVHKQICLCSRNTHLPYTSTFRYVVCSICIWRDKNKTTERKTKIRFLQRKFLGLIFNYYYNIFLNMCFCYPFMRAIE